jgi:protein-tyrosine-phosphatase
MVAGERHSEPPGAPRRRAEPQSILFVCTLNSVRSPMAEAIAKHLHGKRRYIRSAGVRPGAPDGFAVAVLAERGIDMSRHEPSALSELQDDSFDLIVTLSPEAHRHALAATRTLSVEVEYWPTFEPQTFEGGREEQLQAYRSLRDFLWQKIEQRFPVST